MGDEAGEMMQGPETSGDRLVLGLIQRHVGVTRAELTKASSFTQQSVSRIVDRLAKRDLIRIGEIVRNGRGQPSPIVTLNPVAAFSLGLSIMADGVKLIAINLCGEVMAESAIGVESPSPGDVLELTRSFIVALADQGHVPAALAGLGIGITGYFIADGSQVNPPALDDWAFVEIDRVFKDALGIPVFVENDGTAAAVGEALLGYGREVDDFAYLHFAAGFGGGLIRNGRAVRGVSGNAGEFGGMLPPDYLSPSLGRLMQIVKAEAGLSYPTLQAFLDAFDPSWTGVSTWLQEAERSLTLIVNGIGSAVDPGMIILGGRLPEVLALELIERLHFYNPERRGFRRPSPPLRFATSPRDPVAVGAAMLPLQASFF
ncbi:ROK family transcriptional regulator [Sphingomonas sp.]|uniref:ROK family transcriptional regulator n=1 Tax=Alphaproteobacteria TaxID=28211 RepID=UPI00257BAB0F|nr:ROK family transcriptional regulator [Sphingomonas sp.]MBQ1480848.1 ROK family transcriptional regulator [Sphingomonas sp.]MBQ9349859.1 ROK family transcriptional regulator [Phyllobacterium sp.]